MNPQYITPPKDVPHLFLNINCPDVPQSAIPVAMEGNFYTQLLSSLGFDAEDIPLAQLLGGDYIVTPVHWEATHNNAFMRTQGGDKACYTILAEFFAEIGFGLQYVDSDIWLLEVPPNTPPLTAKPVHFMLEIPLVSIMPELDPTHYWQRLHTEIQMYLKTQAATLSTNGVWIWGGAPLQPNSQKMILTDDNWLPLAEKLSKHVTLLKDNPITNHTVVLLDSLPTLPAIKQGSCWFWQDCAWYLPPSTLWNRFLKRIFPCK